MFIIKNIRAVHQRFGVSHVKFKSAQVLMDDVPEDMSGNAWENFM